MLCPGQLGSDTYYGCDDEINAKVINGVGDKIFCNDENILL